MARPNRNCAISPGRIAFHESRVAMARKPRNACTASAP
jgi:hypothetical protein